MTRRRPALAAVALMLAAFGPMAQGDPIPNRDIVLQGDPSSMTVATTNDRGGVDVAMPQGMLIGLLLPAVQKTRITVPVVARVESGRTVLTSLPIQPGSGRDAWFMGRDGRRLTLPIPRGGARVRVTLTEGPRAGAGGPLG